MSKKVEVVEEVEQVFTKGERGEVGTATASLLLKQRHSSEGGGVSLKLFARKLAKDGDEVAKEWLANKLGGSAKARSDKNVALAKTSGSATKAAKRKKKG